MKLEFDTKPRSSPKLVKNHVHDDKVSASTIAYATGYTPCYHLMPIHKQFQIRFINLRNNVKITKNNQIIIRTTAARI